MIHTSQTDFLSVLSQEGAKLLEQTMVENSTIRECSCEEQNACVEELKMKAQKCADECWHADAIKITSKPEDLRQCFVKQKPTANRFIGCVQKNIHSCVNTENGPRIPKQNIKKIIDLAEKKFELSKNKILNNPAVQSIRQVLDAAMEYGECIKDCFKKQMHNGDCFEKNQCQPYIQIERTRRTLRKCVKEIDWKKAIGELCRCSVNAGVSGLNNFCPMFGTTNRKTSIAPS